MNFNRRSALLSALATVAAPLPAWSQKRYGPGVTDTEIKIGSTLPFSGPVSILGVMGKASLAYANKLNAKGGINGRRITLVQYDDGYNPAKALEMTRRLVERDNVSFIFETVGTATNNAIYRYLSAKKIPQLLIFSGANKWGDVTESPYTISGMPSYFAEGRVYARWVLDNVPDAKIAVLMQNDDFGRDYLAGIRAGLGEQAKTLIVAQSTYETTDASVDSQVVGLKASGANVFFSLSNGKFTVQSLKTAQTINWRPQILLPLGSASISAIMKPAGSEAGTGAVTGTYNKQVGDPQFKDDPGIVALQEFIAQWMPQHDPTDSLVAGGYAAMQVLEIILRRCGDDLTRENIMKQAASLRGVTTPLLMPGISLNTTEKNHQLYDHLWLQRYDGSVWTPFGAAVPV